MKHSTTNYEGYQIQKRIDVKSSTCLIYNDGNLIKCIAGDILKDGSENSTQKAKNYIKTLNK